MDTLFYSPTNRETFRRRSECHITVVLKNGLSRMKGDLHVRFLGGGGAAMRCCYPTRCMGSMNGVKRCCASSCGAHKLPFFLEICHRASLAWRPAPVRIT